MLRRLFGVAAAGSSTQHATCDNAVSWRQPGLDFCRMRVWPEGRRPTRDAGESSYPRAGNRKLGKWHEYDDEVI